MAAVSVDSSSPAASLNKGSEEAEFSPSSDKRFWSTLRCRVDALLENKKPVEEFRKDGAIGEGAKRLKVDSMLLLRGFDSVAQSLSQLSDNLDSALQGARDLANPPSLSEILRSTLEAAKNEEHKADKGEENEGKENKGKNRGQKRKLDDDEEDSPKGKLNKAKNIAISMATKAGALARELKSVKSDFSFAQERCHLLEEENRRLRDGIDKGIAPEEDDLVRLQLEALLAEKSRLAMENANLTRENRCLHQLVEYHQLTTQDLSASYENLVMGMCLEFSSHVTLPDGEEGEEEDGNGRNGTLPDGEEEEDGNGRNDAETPRNNVLGLPQDLDTCFDDEL